MKDGSTDAIVHVHVYYRKCTSASLWWVFTILKQLVFYSFFLLMVFFLCLLTDTARWRLWMCFFSSLDDLYFCDVTLSLFLPSECIWIFIYTSDKPLINRHLFNNYHRYYIGSDSNKKDKSSCGCGMDGWLGEGVRGWV